MKGKEYLMLGKQNVRWTKDVASPGMYRGRKDTDIEHFESLTSFHDSRNDFE